MQSRSEATRSHLLQAALELFAQSGYDATGVIQICQRAGVSKGAFYHHFPSKQAIFIQLLEDWLAGLDTLLANFRTEYQSVPAYLLETAGLAENVFQSASGALPMFLEFWTQASRDPAVWQASIAPYRRYQGYFEALIQQGVENHDFGRVDPGVGARVIVAFAVGLLLQGLLDPQGADWVQVARQGMAYLVQGLQGGEA